MLCTVNSSRRGWTPEEEDRFLRVWYMNLPAFYTGKKRTEVYKELEPEFLNNGIQISAANIKSKMETFKRKYFHFINENKSRKNWRNFDKMVAIMGYEQKAKESEERCQNLDNSTSGTFSSVYIDEVETMLFNEEDSFQNAEVDANVASCPTWSAEEPQQKQAIKRKWKSEDNLQPIPVITNAVIQKPRQQRRIWSHNEEEVFLVVWDKFSRDLRSERKKTHVHRDMEAELLRHGMDLSSSDIKAKIESFKRKFRHYRDNQDLNTKWVHYETVAELIGALEATKFDQYSENSNSSNYTDELSLFNESMPLYPQTCLNTHEVDTASTNKTNGHKVAFPAKSTGDKYGSNPASAVNDIVADEDFQSELLNDDSMEQSVSQSSSQMSRKIGLTEQFGEFVTKELNMLSDDLLIEAKRKIYNVLCDMQMKQIQLNKSSQ